MTQDTPDANLSDSSCDVDVSANGLQCTLRAALEEANVTTAADQIEFSISTGKQTILPTLALPEIDQPVTVDGTTQPGYAGMPLIEITGSSAGDAEGLVLDANNSTLIGLTINGFDMSSGGGRSGILLRGTDNEVLACWIGLDDDGVTPQGNYWGINVQGDNNSIGGPGLDGNVISGNIGTGLPLDTANNNVIQGNFIGTDFTGTLGVGNGAGVNFYFAEENRLGGAAAGARNLISGNSENVFSQAGARNLILGNLIGTNVSGKAALDLSPGPGIALFEGGTLLPAEDYVIGSPNAPNVIAGNADGIRLSGTGHVVQSNFIGVTKNGKPLANSGHGIEIFNSDPTSRILIGGSATESNQIARNQGDGINIAGPDDSRVRILRNSINRNGELGIDILPDGPTPNDAGDSDLGPNKTQNFPKIKYVAPLAGATKVRGTLSSAPNENFKIQLYSTPKLDPTGFGEGHKFQKLLNASTNASGKASFSTKLSSALPPGSFVTATATDSKGDTSEFSMAAVVCTILGTGQDNKLEGTKKADVICGKGGDDEISGKDGNDVLLGGSGGDDLNGGKGKDFCLQGPGSGKLVSCEKP